jgi:hypothetical protein
VSSEALATQEGKGGRRSPARRRRLHSRCAYLAPLAAAGRRCGLLCQRRGALCGCPPAPEALPARLPAARAWGRGAGQGSEQGKQRCQATSRRKTLTAAAARCCVCFLSAGAEDQAAACRVPRGAPRLNGRQRAGVRPPGLLRVHSVIRPAVFGGVTAQRRCPVCRGCGFGASPSSVTRVPMWCLNSRDDETNGRRVRCWKLSVRAVAFACGVNTDHNMVNNF